MSSRAAAAGRGGDSSCAPVHSHSHICPAPPAPGPLSPSLRILRWRRQHPWSYGGGCKFSALGLDGATHFPAAVPACQASVAALGELSGVFLAQIECGIPVPVHLPVLVSGCAGSASVPLISGEDIAAPPAVPFTRSGCEAAREARGGAQGSSQLERSELDREPRADAPQQQQCGVR